MARSGSKPLILGFLGVRDDAADGLAGGYLLTTEFGRPLEFHYTAPLKLSGPQRILYGAGYRSYVYGEAIGKALTDRQSTAPRILLAADAGFLALRPHIPAPIVRLSRESSGMSTDCHSDFEQDGAAFEKIRRLTPENFDWLEPFDRIREALSELRDRTMGPLAA
jgi:hypothetical protein